MDAESAPTTDSEKVGNRTPRLPNSFLEYDHIKLSSWGYPLKSHKFRYPLRFAPIEIPDKILDDSRLPRSRPQAQRCPHCNALVATGHSFDDHVFFCDRALRPGLWGKQPVFIVRGVKP